jgi:hypothetical protein
MRLQQQTKKNQKTSTAALILETTLKKVNIITWHDTGLCQCLECGALLNVLTHAHAAKHGYKDKFDLIAAGKVKFLGIKEHRRNDQGRYT